MIDSEKKLDACAGECAWASVEPTPANKESHLNTQKKGQNGTDAGMGFPDVRPLGMGGVGVEPAVPAATFQA